MNVSGRTRVYGLIGAPVAHSLSPRLVNEAFAHLGHDGVYVAFPSKTGAVGELVSGLDALGIAGVNVTYPLKADVVPYLVETSDAVAAIGAANVLVLRPGGGYRGENTDAPGTALAVRTWLGAPCERVVILGAGGAARAAAYGLLTTGVTELTFVVRETARARRAVAGLGRLSATANLSVATLDEATAAFAGADLVIQATPVGLDDPAAPPLVEPDRAPRAHGLEMNYGQTPTAFQRAWQQAGRTCLDGRDLLAAQAHLAIGIWCGQAPPLAQMRAWLGTIGEVAR